MTDHLLIEPQPAATTRARLLRPAAPRRDERIDATGATHAERLRAHTALAALWSGVAVAIIAYAITQASVGAAVVAAFTAWAIRLAWSAAWRSSGDEKHARPLTFIP